jgi:YD repeat-containing protein
MLVRRLAGCGVAAMLALVLCLFDGGSSVIIPLAHADVTDCIGHADGQAYCTKPEPGPWSMGYCPDEAANSQISQIQCGCAGGVWDFNAGCQGARTDQSEDEMLAQSACFLQHRVFCGNISTNFPGWSALGTSVNVSQCGLFQAKAVNNIEISNYAIMPTTGNSADASGNCTVPGNYNLPVGKSRALACPLGYNARGLPDGSIECWRLPYCPTCNGKDTQALGGGLAIGATDYPAQGDSAQATGSASPGSSVPTSGPSGADFPVTFIRSYSNTPYYASTQGADRGIYGFNVNWVSNYDMHVFTDPTLPTITGTVQRQGGWVKNFDANGDEIGALIGSQHDKLVKLTDTSGNVTGFRYIASSGDQVETYDASGNLLTIQNRAGLTQTLTYSNATTPAAVAPRPGLLITISDPFGRSLNLIHDSLGRVTRMTDPAGGNTDYVYDDNGNLATVTFPDDGSGHRAVRHYLYNEAGYTANMPAALTGITDENGVRYASYHYHPWGFVQQREYAGGVDQMNVTQTEHDERYVSYTNGTPGSTTVSTSRLLYANVNGMLQTTDIYDDATGEHLPCSDCGSVAKKTFDTNGFIASTQDFNGNLNCYTNDARGNETARVEGLAGATCPGTNTAATRTTNTAWDTTFHLPLSVAEPLRITTYTYDTTGNLLTKSIQATTDTTGATGFGATPAPGTSPRTWTYTYNTNGQVLTANGPRTDVADVATYTYYDNADADTGKRGKIATITNALGQVTQITAYDLHGHPLTVVDPNGLTTQLTYDGRQRLIHRNVGSEQTSYLYDDLSLLKQTTMPDGSSVSYTYDDAHRLVSVQDNQGNHINYTLDVRGNRVKEDVYDPASTLAQTRSRAFDVLNRLQKDTGAQAQTTQYAYDLQGNLLTVSDPLNRVTTNSYDPLNRLATMTQPAPAAGQAQPVIGYAYNGLDQMIQVTDPRSLVTSYAYDGLGNLNTQVSPDTGTTANTYDVAGNILTSTDAKSQVTSYTYDALNRVASLTYNQATGTQLKTVAYTYDQTTGGNYGIGRLTGVTETAADGATVLQTTQYAYDIHGRLIQENRGLAGQNFVTAYAYDAATGHLTGMTYPSGRTLAYSYDAVGRISQISSTAPAAQGGQTQTLVSSIAYQPFGGVKSYTLGNNQQVTRSYDQDGRVSGYNLGAAQYAIGYDPASRIVSLLNTGNVQISNSYSYDDLDRLTLASLPGSTSFNYAYDLTGNRTSKTFGGGGADNYTISAASNRIAQITGNVGRSFGYDANGSTTADGNNTYAYDARGRMWQSQGAGGTVTYQVGANGQRVRKTSGLTGDTLFIYDAQGKLITEATAAGLVKREYLYLLDIPVAVNVQ